MGVEAQHVAILLAVQALVGAGAADLIALPPDATKLPAAAGSVGFPERVLPDHGRPSRERRSSAVRRRNRKQDPIVISEAELTQMTRDLDDAHHDTLPSMRDSLAEWSDSDADIRSGITRLVSTPVEPPGVPARWWRGARWRRAGRGVASAVASPPRPPARRGPRVPAASGQKLTGDLAVVALAAALENLAVGTYQAGIDAATAGQASATSRPRSSPSPRPRRASTGTTPRRGTVCSPARARRRSPGSTSP